MIAELANGTVVSGTAVGSEVVKEAQVAVTLERINQYLGTALDEATVNEIFEALGFAYEVNQGAYEITIPPRRWDIAIEADIIEEVARIYGYDHLPSTLPSGETVAGSLKAQHVTRQLKSLLEGHGTSEAISYALTTEKIPSIYDERKSNNTFAMSEERSVLRMNLISGLLDDVAYNVARKIIISPSTK